MGTVPFSTFPRFHIPILDIGKELLEQSERINREGLHVSAGFFCYLKWKIPAVTYSRLAYHTDIFILEELSLFLEFIQEVVSTTVFVEFLATGFAHLKELFFLINAKELTA